MIFWIGLIFSILGLILASKWAMRYEMGKGLIGMLAGGFSFLWILVHIIIGCAIFYEHTDMHKYNLNIRYEQLEANKGNDYLIQDIINWNKDLTFYKKYQRNFWIGPYISNIYDNYKTIEIEH